MSREIATADAMEASTSSPAKESYEGGEYSSDGKVFIKYKEKRKRQHYYSVKEGTKFINENAFTCEGTPGDGVWDSEDALYYITLPNGLIEIKEGAFSYCWYLTHLTIPSTVTKIGSGAFADCQNLEEIRIPSGVQIIEPYTFSNCHSLRYVEVSEGVLVIAENAFNGAAISYIKLPSSIRRVKKNAFSRGLIRTFGLIIELAFNETQLEDLLGHNTQWDSFNNPCPLAGIFELQGAILLIPYRTKQVYMKYFPHLQIVEQKQ